MKKFFYVFITIGYIFMLLSLIIKSGSFGMIVGSLLIAAVFVAIVILGKRIDVFLERKYALCTTVIIVFAAVIQFLHIDLLRYTPAFDMEAIFNGATELIETGDFASYHSYFGYYFNNYGVMRLLYHFLRVGRLFTKDYFLIAALFNEITILLTFLFSSLIARKLFGARFGILVLLFFVSMPPFIFMTDVFYTDSLSMLYPVLLIYLAMMNRKRAKWVQWLICAGFAVLSYIGGTVKANVYIVPVAVCICELVYKNYKRFLQYLVCLLVICISFHALSMGYLYRHYIPKDELSRTKTPILHWVMMGLEGNGRYNGTDEAFTRSFDDPDERDKALLEEIGKRLKDRGLTGMVRLFADKTKIDYGDGTLGLSDFLDDGPVNQSQVQEHILYDGAYYDSYYKWCTAIFYAILMLGGAGILCEVFAGFMHRKSNLFVVSLAFFGDYAFLMMWEATQRYCTNFLPLVMIMASGGVFYLENLLERSEVPDRILKLTQKYSREISVFAGAFGLRLGIYVFSFLIIVVLMTQGQFIHLSDFIDGWRRWDAYNYVRIAQESYTNAWLMEPGSLSYLPLYPWLMGVLHLFIPDMMICGMAVSTICFSAGCIFFDKLMRRETGTSRGGYALAALICYPFAFYLGAVDTQALFFLLCSMFFWYLRNHRWRVTAIIGILACMTQLQGLLLLIAVAAELMYFKRGWSLLRKKRIKEFFRRLGIPFGINLSMLAGFVIYLIINITVAGSPLYFISSKHQKLTDGFSFVWKTIYYITCSVRDMWGSPEWFCIWLPEFVIFFVYIWGIIYLIRKKIRPVYTVYLTAYGLILYSSSWLLNGPKITITALPLFMAIGIFIGDKPQIRKWILIGSAVLSLLYLTAFLRFLPVL